MVPGHCDRCGSDVPSESLGLDPPEFAPQGGYDQRRCLGCGVLFYSPRYGQREWLDVVLDRGAQFRSAEHLARTGTWEGMPTGLDPTAQLDTLGGYYHGVWSRLQQLADRPVSSVLDVGCGVGHSLDAARDLGLLPYGVEPDPGAYHYASTKGIVDCATLQETKMLGPFDAVLMSDCIEHTFTPFQDLLKARAMTRPGGALEIKTFAQDMAGAAFYRTLSHEWAWTCSQLAEWMEAAGWRIVGRALDYAHAQITLTATRGV